MWYTYIIRCKDGTLYTGVTTDLSRRIKEHNNKKGGRYTRTRLPVKLVYKEKHPTQSAALKREFELKGWTKERKLSIIQHVAKS